jgi:putative transcriptional regulator
VVSRFATAIIVLAVATAGAGLSRVGAAAGQDGRWLTGQFLVATEKLRDPRFDHTVIYLIQHDADGAMGLVVNRPIGPMPAAQILEAFGLDTNGVTGDLRVHYGGPVQPRRGLVLHTADYTDPSTRIVHDGIAMTAEQKILSAIARGKGPRQSLFAFGYAGWAPDQLEGEIRDGAWITVPADATLLFDADHARKWERATARLRIRL